MTETPMSSIKQTMVDTAKHLLSTYNAGGGIESITIQELTDDVRVSLAQQGVRAPESLLVDTCDGVARAFTGCDYDGEEILFLGFEPDLDLTDEEWYEYFDNS